MNAGPIWKPSVHRVRGSTMWRFMQQASALTGHAFGDYPALYRWSIAEPELAD